MATIRKRGERYQVQVRRKGCEAVTRSFAFIVDANAWAREMERLADRRDLEPSRKALETITLSQLVKRYNDEVVPSLKSAEKERYIVAAFLRHPICKRSLANLTVADFAKYRDERLKEVTPKSLKRMLSPISHMFELAKDEWGIPLKENPLSRLRLKVTDNRRERRLREGELNLLLGHSVNGTIDGKGNQSNRQRNPLIPIIIQFAIETAMRRGEMLALRWADVDTVRRSATILEAKNGLSRTIPLSLKAIALLQEAKALQTNPAIKDRIFPMTANSVRLAWERLCKRAGIEDLHFHDLRHESVSRLFEKGLSVPEVASISGHRDMRMLFRYSHANNKVIIDKLDLL